MLYYHNSLDLLLYNIEPYHHSASSETPMTHLSPRKSSAFRRPIRAVLAVTGATLALAAAPALAAPPRVITDVPVTGSLVAQVMGDLATPETLLPAGSDPHDYQLRPSQAGALQDADLLIWVGPALTPWLDRAAGSLGANTESLQLLAVSGVKLREYGNEAAAAHDHDHGDDHGDAGHEEGHDHSGDSEGAHVHSGTDPHAWLNPENGKIWLHAIADALSAKDPENAAIYQRNAGMAAGEIGRIEGGISARLASARGKKFVVLHDAYGYFTERFGLEPAVAISLGDASTPSAARLREIKSELAAVQAVCAFPEQGHDTRLIAAVTEGTATRQGAALDPEGTALNTGPALYTELLSNLGNSLAECLSD